MLAKLKNSQKGFTLLELLIVIVIIGILAVLIIPNLAAGPLRARDTQRKQDLRNIKTALEAYHVDNSNYPQSTDVLDDGSTPYMKTVPQDPKNQGVYIYSYTPDANPANNYTLVAHLENKSDKDIKSGTTDTYEITNAQ